MAATLKQLVKVKSLLVEEVLAFLHQLADMLDATHWMRRSGQRVRASDIAIELFVLTKEERARPPRRGPEGVEEHAIMGRQSLMDEIEAARYELPARAEECEEARWQQIVRRGRARLGVKGAPGSGKTFTTRHTMAELARGAARKLDRLELSVEEIEAPIWVTAKTLGQASASSVGDVLLDALENTFPQLRLAATVPRWLQRAIGSPRGFIVVDALDELEERDRAGFEGNAKRLDSLSGRVVVTCRTMQWEERKNWLGWHNVVEVELAPLKHSQQREFGRRFFGQKGDRLTDQQVNEVNAAPRLSMERLLQVNFALRHACTAPLLLTFGCLLHEDGKVKEGTTYAQLYADIRRKLVCGEWRSLNAPKPEWVGNGVREERRFRYLEGIAWGLFSKSPHLNRFTLDDWDEAAGELAKAGRAAPVDPADFLEELEQVGFVVPAGYDEQRRDRCWSFAHRTLLEFLAACALSRMQQDAWLEEAKKHFWFEPEWLEVLTFLAGLVDDATPLIEAVEKEQENDDLFGSMLYLKSRLVGAASKLDEQIVIKSCHEVLSGYKRKAFDVLNKFMLPNFRALAVNEKARQILLLNKDQAVLVPREEYASRMLALILNRDQAEVDKYGKAESDPFERFLRFLDINAIGGNPGLSAAVRALGAIGDSRAVETLLKLVEVAGWSYERVSAVEALVEIGDQRAFHQLFDLVVDAQTALDYQRYDYHAVIGAGRAAIRAIAAMADSELVDQLLKLTEDKGWWKRQAATRVLAAIGDAKTVDNLLKITKQGLHIAAAAAYALGEIGDVRAVQTLLDLMPHDLGDVVRGTYIRSGVDVTRAAAEALQKIGDPRAVDHLLRLLEANKNPYGGSVRALVATALGGIVSERVLNEILKLTDDRDWPVRAAAVEALGRIGGARSAQRLLELVDIEKDWAVQRNIAKALGKIAPPGAVLKLLRQTEHQSKDVCNAAAQALGEIRDPEAVDRLLELLDNSGSAEAAAEALGKIGDARAIDRLTNKMHDNRLAKAEALWRISWRNRVKINP